LFTLILTACSTQAPASTNTPLRTETSTPSATTTTITPSQVPPTLTQSLTPSPTSIPSPVVCSLLEGVEILDLPALITNPFAPPRLGSDDPHQGVDFSVIEPVYQIALEGQPVHAVMDGVVAGVIDDRFPYGNALLVETPLEPLPDNWVAALHIPTPAPPRQEQTSLTCPEGNPSENWDKSRRSLYLIYAHLKEPPALQVGEAITCGQALNAIGNSGNSLNPHIHLELRVGPAGASFESMAHYTGSASPQEMYNYCLWRVSETFQLLDPMHLFELNPK